MTALEKNVESFYGASQSWCPFFCKELTAYAMIELTKAWGIPSW